MPDSRGDAAMNMTKRLEALEAAAVKAEGPKKIDIIRVIVALDRSITGAYCRNENGRLVPVSDEKLADIRRQARAEEGSNK